MEGMIGYALFVRPTRGVTLTPVGEFLRRRAELLCTNLADTIETAKRVGRGEQGTLIVRFSGSVMFSKASSVIERYRSGYPAVDCYCARCTRMSNYLCSSTAHWISASSGMQSRPRDCLYERSPGNRMLPFYRNTINWLPGRHSVRRC
jgi:hypothetical protein